MQNLGGVIRRPNSGRFDADHAHAEHDQSTFIGNSQIEVGRIPELLSDIGQELARVFHGGTLGVVNGLKLKALIVLHAQFGRMVCVEIESRHGGATQNTAFCCQT